MNDPLEEIGARRALAKRILDDINQFCVDHYDEDHRHHLGASLIGDECARKLWYSFRWVFKEQFSGRMQRLFARGHHEEENMVFWLKGIGATVNEFQEDGKTQFRMKGAHGHYGGSLDGLMELAAKYGDLGTLLGEFKTSSDKYFKQMLKEQSVAIAKPVHFAQMSTYGKKYNLKYAIYMMLNKNTDEIYIEVVKLDWGLAETLERKAEDIIFSQIPPVKLSQDSTFYKCKFCCYTAICHSGAPVEKNCRSCTYAYAAEDGKWWCNLFQNTIPKDFLSQGCDKHEPIV